MEKHRLIYGTYRQKEWEQIVAIFEELNVEYKESLHIHSFKTWTGDEDVWYFHQLETAVDKPTELEIRRRRDPLKKFYG
ncbi:MAG: hypothetical protein IKE16_08600 [Solobacterium sp.]|nr:hypothetical protein [Solobacterium sp.]MBR2770052.1 hypothetical protein [Solobacterium sp.]MBR2794691.1 hypothetical protein [Solobacterium sp.]